MVSSSDGGACMELKQFKIWLTERGGDLFVVAMAAQLAPFVFLAGGGRHGWLADRLGPLLKFVLH
jgi:hypothetical protein